MLFYDYFVVLCCCHSQLAILDPRPIYDRYELRLRHTVWICARNKFIPRALLGDIQLCGFELEINLFLALLRDFQLCGFELEINLILAITCRCFCVGIK